ncbi:MAG TPA: hypothetical protein DDW52_17670 [Planctomycetaceae bacterium]|nr:hypothetical protein [Planctomycetaceae bacterium]
MRLTLRTLLAYRDRVLQPNDREDLHARIQNNEFSGNLLRRIESVSTRRDVSAPPVLGNGLGADPNSVAEYLDDSLPAPQVPEFERATLTSDVQVAELAHCHSILASGLGEQVGVPGDLYEKVIALAHGDDKPKNAADPIVRVDEAHLLSSRKQNAASAELTNVTAPMVASAGETIRPEGLDLENASIAQEVPEYLVGSKRGAWLLPVSIGGLLAVLCLLIWQTLGPLDRVASLLTAPENATDSEAIEPNNSGTPGEDTPVPGESGTADPALAVPGSDDAVGDVDADATIESDVPNDKAGSESTSPATAIPADPDLDAADTNVPPTADPANQLFATWQPADSEEQLATVLVRDSNSHLSGLDVGEGTGVGNELILPNTVATTLVLPGGLQLQNLGDSIITLAEVRSPDGQMQVPELDIAFCKCVLHNPTASMQQIIIKDSKRPIAIAIEANGRIAIDVGLRQARHGSILNERTGRRVRVLLQIEGSSRITDSAASTQAVLPIGEAQAWIDSEKARQFAVLQIPTWLRPAATRPIDRVAAGRLQQRIAAGQENGTSLTKLLDQVVASGSPEVVALAVEIQILTGDIASLPRALGSERLSGYWPELIDVARQCFASGRTMASEARDQFMSVGLASEDAEQFVAQIVGQESTSSFRDEAAAFVEQLESPQLQKRVLAIYQLRTLTGSPGGFLPHRPRRELITQWRKLVSSDRFKTIAPPDLVYERTAATP